jgi:lipoprotein-anchoring transpeptidase ErfK/SrfK
MRLWSAILMLALALFFSSCETKDNDHRILVSVADQSLALYHKATLLARYPVSTSKFGLGDHPGSRATPLGRMEVARMIGAGAPLGAVFKSRRRTGEVLKPDAPGRDPIVTRIIWLKGLEPQNQHAFARCIYIHGTAEERNVGRPASYGCVRMRSVDVLRVFNAIGIGAIVDIIPGSLPEPPGQSAPAPKAQVVNVPAVGPPAPTPAPQAVAVATGTPSSR